jgi:hypothetical protein
LLSESVLFAQESDALYLERAMGENVSINAYINLKSVSQKFARGLASAFPLRVDFFG